VVERSAVYHTARDPCERMTSVDATVIGVEIA
jgi:hypothetical protein